MSEIKNKKYLKGADGNLYSMIPPSATETEYGGIKAKQKTNDSQNNEVVIDTNGSAYVDSYKKSEIDERIEGIELFKFPNATIIGEPLIDSGQISRFSNENYLIFPFIVDVRNKNFEINFCFTTGSDVTTQQNILDSAFGLALAIRNGRGLMALSSNGTNFNLGESVGTLAILPNHTYYAKLEFDGTKYTTKLSQDMVSYTEDMRVVSSEGLFPIQIFIGGSPDLFGAGTAHPFKGSINLNRCSLSVAGLDVWQGMDDAGLSTRANVSLSNLDAEGEGRFTSLSESIVKKLDKPETGAEVGKILAVKEVRADGSMVVEWVDKPEGNVNDVQIDGVSILDEDKNANFESSNVETVDADYVRYVVQNLTDEQKAQAKTNIDASRITSVYLPRCWTKANFDNYSTFGRSEQWTAPTDGIVVGDIFTIKVSITDCYNLNGYILVQVTGVDKSRNVLVGTTLFACTRYMEKEVLTKAEQLSERQRIGIDKPWVLKGTLTEDNISSSIGVNVDMVGCTEMVIVGQFTSTSSANLSTNVQTLADSYFVNGSRTNYIHYIDTKWGIEPVVDKYRGAINVNYVYGNGTAVTWLNNKHISDIKNIRSSTSAQGIITYCNIEIWAR